MDDIFSSSDNLLHSGEPSQSLDMGHSGRTHSISLNDERKADISSLPSEMETASATNEDSARRVSAIVRKVDWRMLPLLGLLSAFSLIDRSNLGLARTAGMDHALHTNVGSRYSIVTCVYFIPYIVLQLPSNLFLRRLGVVNWLAFLVIAWGAVQLSMGFVPSWGYLALTRTLLGAFEAGFFPAMVYIITTWYTRHEVQTRLAAFYMVGVFVGGFSAIFAYVLTLLNGTHGIAGWAWIFIIEGAITMGLGIVAWFFLPSFPDQNTFLTQEETLIILERVEEDRGDSVPDTLTKEKLFNHLLDWKLWVMGLMYMCATLPAYAISFFVTIILRGMGWSIAASLLLAAPPYVFASISIMVFAWISDKYRHRAGVIAFQAVMTIAGLSMTGFSLNASARYAGIFLATAGSAGCIPGLLAHSANNIVSHTKRAVATAITVAFGGIGGIFASLVFRQQDSPDYKPGIYATIACQCFMLVLLVVTTIHYRAQNRKIEAGKMPAFLEGREGFRYTL